MAGAARLISSASPAGRNHAARDEPRGLGRAGDGGRRRALRDQGRRQIGGRLRARRPRIEVLDGAGVVVASGTTRRHALAGHRRAVLDRGRRRRPRRPPGLLALAGAVRRQRRSTRRMTARLRRSASRWWRQPEHRLTVKVSRGRHAGRGSPCPARAPPRRHRCGGPRELRLAPGTYALTGLEGRLRRAADAGRDRRRRSVAIEARAQPEEDPDARWTG